MTPVADSLPQLRLRLPGQWWQVPLHDEVQARDSVKRLVERRLGTSDEHARLRAELRSQSWPPSMLEFFDAIVRVLGWAEGPDVSRARESR